MRKQLADETCITYIPARHGREAVSTASRVCARGYVRESRSRGGVQPGVEEAERRLASSDKFIVEKRDDAGEDGA